MLVTIREFQKNEGSLFITTHPHIHPDNEGFRRFEKGRFTPVFMKAQSSFTNVIKNGKTIKWTPWECVRISVRFSRVFVQKTKNLTLAQFLYLVRQIPRFLRVWGGSGTTFGFVSVRQNMSKLYFAHFPNLKLILLKISKIRNFVLGAVHILCNMKGERVG